MTTDFQKQRKLLRDYVIAQRNALTREQLDAAARDLCLLLESTPEYHHAVNIAAYWPVKGEADVRPVIEQTIRYNKHVYLPVVDRETQTLNFALYEPGMEMKKNEFGIPEPHVDPEHLIDPRQLDMAIVPLVVFDSYGNRLGMGGGHYDRTFAFLKEEPEVVAPCLVGAAHEFQHTAELPTHPGDVPLRLVVTEQQVWRPIAAQASAIAADAD